MRYCNDCPLEGCQARRPEGKCTFSGAWELFPQLPLLTLEQLRVYHEELDNRDWEKFRREAAKDMVVGMLAHATRYHPRNPKETDWHHAIVEEGIELADELIKQLREEKQ